MAEDHTAHRALRIAAPLVGQRLHYEDRCNMVLAHRCMRDAHVFVDNHVITVSELGGDEDEMSAAESLERKVRAVASFKPLVKTVHVDLPPRGALPASIVSSLVSSLGRHAPSASVFLRANCVEALWACRAASLSSDKVRLEIDGIDSMEYVREVASLLQVRGPEGRGPEVAHVALRPDHGLNVHEVLEGLAVENLGRHVRAMYIPEYTSRDANGGAPLSREALAALASVEIISVVLKQTVRASDRPDLLAVATHVHDHVLYDTTKGSFEHLQSMARCRRLRRLYVNWAAGGQLATQGSAMGVAIIVENIYAATDAPDFSVYLCRFSVEDPGVVALATDILRRLAALPKDVRRDKSVVFALDVHTETETADAPEQALCARLAFLQVHDLAVRGSLPRPQRSFNPKNRDVDSMTYAEALAELSAVAPYLHAAWALLAPPARG
jgi:hypothetical protein